MCSGYITGTAVQDSRSEYQFWILVGILVWGSLYVEEEMHDVAVLYDIFLTLYSELSSCPTSGF